MGTRLPLPLQHDTPRDRLARPLSDLRISVIDACNFRCPYCMPAEAFATDHAFLRREQWLSFDEIERLARAFAMLGVRKLRITGGEPLLRRDLHLLVRRLRAIAGIEDIALTTNGTLLPRHAAALREAGLDRVTVSLDTLDEATFAQLSGGRGTPAQVLRGVDAAVRAGFTSIKFNCVVIRGVNDEGVPELVQRFRHTPHVLRFIEYMDVGTMNRWRAGQVVPSAELLARIHACWPLRAVPPRDPAETARRYAFVDGGGEIGFISSVSAPFCGACSRARLSADGQLFTCLFAAHGIDLRTPLRQGIDDASLLERLADIWSGRSDRYSERRAEQRGRAANHVEMFRVGG